MGEWITNALLGTGFLVGIISAWVTFKNNKSSNELEWYDRAIQEIERLEERLEKAYAQLDEMEAELKEVEGQLDVEKKVNSRLTDENKILSDTIVELKSIIREIQTELDNLNRKVDEQ